MDAIELQNVFHTQRRFRWETKSWHWEHRITLLRLLRDAIRKHEAEICRALRQDFEKPELETLMTEIYPVLEEIHFTLKNLRRWTRPQRVFGGLLLWGTRSEIRLEPRGNVLIISPWNYPFSLAMMPLVSALAAGNTVILKPSELTPHTSALIQKILTEIFEPTLVSVALGGKVMAEQLLALPFDHIFFTGSTAVGKVVMRAASENLSSVTLELGGKSPAIVDASCDLKRAAEKIVWGKFLNGGQTCVAPDYLFVHQDVARAFTILLEREIEKQLAGQIGAQIISEQHLQRLQQLINQAQNTKPQVAPSTSGMTLNSRRLRPTLLENPPPDSRVMQEEIFGPVLPVMTYNDPREVIHFINDRPKPLALYIFSKNIKMIEALLSQTSSGGVCVNDTILHLGNLRLPFGGVGASGFGSYHGFAGFKTFSHEKSILFQGAWGRAVNFFYPPYSERQTRIFRILIKWLT